MPTPFKTPMQMMYENAHLPHYAGGGKADVIEQFAGRIQNAIRQYTKAAGKPPSAQEVKQLEDHIRGLTQPAPQAPMTQARAAAQEPFANKLVDQSGRVYGTVPHPKTGAPVTPERALAPEMRDQFGTSPSNYSVRQATMEPLHVNAFPEDDFMSMANTGRASSRTWNKSYTPSAEDLAQRQHMAEDVGMQMDEGADLGGLAQARVSEGDIPQMTSASAPFAERSGALEAGALNQLSGDILQGKHAKTIEAVIADFRSRGIEPDREDILNAINAQINPLRHNYTGENPIGLRPSLPSGARSTPEMDQWRDAMRMSGQPETTVSTHPSDWNAAPKRDYLLDTEAGARQPFAENWDIQQLEDKRRRRAKAGIGEIQSSPNDRPSNIGYAAGGQISPRDMQAQMMVHGYKDGGAVKPTGRELDELMHGGRYTSSVDQVLADNYFKRQAQSRGDIKESPASPRERIASLGQEFLEKAGVRRPIARRASQTVVGGPSSAIPGGFGAADIAAMNPGVAALIAPMYAAETGHSLGQGNYGEAALNALGVLPAAATFGRAATPSAAVLPRGMNPEARIAEEAAGRPFQHMAGMSAPSNAERQQWIGQSHAKGAEAFYKNDPAYKAAVFNAWRQSNPELIAQTGAQNYDDLMKASYGAASRETGEQFGKIPNKVEFWGPEEYLQKDYLARAQAMGIKPAELMRQELSQGKPFQVFKDQTNPHPYLADVDPVTGVNANEKFRAVHDYFGHLGTKTPNTFGPKGEENAWMAHRQMFSPLAEPALTAETRGQNSYVNYVNPKNVELRKKGKPTTEFAENVPVLLPPEASNPEYLGGLPSYLQGIVK